MYTLLVEVLRLVILRLRLFQKNSWKNLAIQIFQLYDLFMEHIVHE